MVLRFRSRILSAFLSQHSSISHSKKKEGQEEEQEVLGSSGLHLKNWQDDYWQ